jgi:hypothetical protein
MTDLVPITEGPITSGDDTQDILSLLSGIYNKLNLLHGEVTHTKQHVSALRGETLQLKRNQALILDLMGKLDLGSTLTAELDSQMAALRESIIDDIFQAVWNPEGMLIQNALDVFRETLVGVAVSALTETTSAAVNTVLDSTSAVATSIGMEAAKGLWNTIFPDKTEANILELVQLIHDFTLSNRDDIRNTKLVLNDLVVAEHMKAKELNLALQTGLTQFVDQKLTVQLQFLRNYIELMQ